MRTRRRIVLALVQLAAIASALYVGLQLERSWLPNARWDADVTIPLAGGAEQDLTIPCGPSSQLRRAEPVTPEDPSGGRLPNEALTRLRPLEGLPVRFGASVYDVAEDACADGEGGAQVREVAKLLPYFAVLLAVVVGSQVLSKRDRQRSAALAP